MLTTRCRPTADLHTLTDLMLNKGWIFQHFTFDKESAALTDELRFQTCGCFVIMIVCVCVCVCVSMQRLS